MIKAKYIERLRKNLGLPQERMAKELGISRPTYVQIEKGERELTVGEAQTLASIFGLTLDDLIAGREPGRVEVVVKKRAPKAKPKDSRDIRISVPQENAEKFREALVYILKKVGWKPNFGMAVLYKILYFIDFDYYEKYEEQLLGATYIKNHFGPTPVMFAKIVGQMKENNEIDEVKSKFFEYQQTKFVVNPEREPDLSAFSAREIKHIDDELQKLSDKTASELKDYSHKDVPWLSAEEGQPLNYESVFYRTDETSVRHYDREDQL